MLPFHTGQSEVDLHLHLFLGEVNVFFWIISSSLSLLSIKDCFININFWTLAITPRIYTLESALNHIHRKVLKQNHKHWYSLELQASVKHLKKCAQVLQCLPQPCLEYSQLNSYYLVITCVVYLLHHTILNQLKIRMSIIHSLVSIIKLDI